MRLHSLAKFDDADAGYVVTCSLSDALITSTQPHLMTCYKLRRYGHPVLHCWLFLGLMPNSFITLFHVVAPST